MTQLELPFVKVMTYYDRSGAYMLTLGKVYQILDCPMYEDSKTFCDVIDDYGNRVTVYRSRFK